MLAHSCSSGLDDSDFYGSARSSDDDINMHLINYGQKKVQKSYTTIRRQLFMGGQLIS
jgi:hypothetical protein